MALEELKLIEEQIDKGGAPHSSDQKTAGLRWIAVSES
jgi:hypothetical protein